MPVEPRDEKPDRSPRYHHGPVSPDGGVLFDGSWGGCAGVGGETTDFAADYALPGFAPASALPASAFLTSAAPDANAASSGAMGPATQAQVDPTSSGLVIVADYDGSITSLKNSSPTLYAEITGAITAAIDFYEAKISTSMTVTIDFGYDEFNGMPIDPGDLGESLANYAPVSFDTLRAALVIHAASVGLDSVVENLPTVSPDGDTWYVSDSELEALGLAQDIPPGTTVDGYVGLSDSASFTYNPDDRAVSGHYDAIGVLEHEISEDMGRVANYGEDNFSPLDLFRYVSPGSIATTGTAAYFSIDGGNSNLDQFNNNLKHGGDPGDWSSAPGDINPVVDDSYDAFASIGVANLVSPTDLTVMEALGYSLGCFVAGTRIATARGEVAIEVIGVGELVRVLLGGDWAPVTWVGRREVDCARHPAPRKVWPVRVAVGAFGPGRPGTELLLSPDHAVYVNEVLVPVKHLINGGSIVQVPMARVSYCHIELPQHDVVLAHGLPAESFLDVKHGMNYGRGDGPIWLYPDYAARMWEAFGCARLIVAGPELVAARALVAGFSTRRDAA